VRAEKEGNNDFRIVVAGDALAPGDAWVVVVVRFVNAGEDCVGVRSVVGGGVALDGDAATWVSLVSFVVAGIVA